MFRLNLSAQTHSFLNYLKQGRFTHLRHPVSVRPVYFFNMFDMCKHFIYKKKKKKRVLQRSKQSIYSLYPSFIFKRFATYLEWQVLITSF